MKITKNYKKKIFAFTAILFWIAVWHFTALYVDKPILLPTPYETLSVLKASIVRTEFWEICLHSVKNIFLGAVARVVFGVCISVLSYISTAFKYLISPLMSLIKSTPIASFIILLLVWIGKEKIPFWVSLMMVTPIVASNLIEGLENISVQLKEVAIVYNLNFAKRWKMLYRHSLLPYFNSSLKSGIALAWKAGIAAEVLCTPDKSIGRMLYESKLYIETSSLFAWTLTVIFISFVLERTVVYLSDRFIGGAVK